MKYRHYDSPILLKYDKPSTSKDEVLLSQLLKSQPSQSDVYFVISFNEDDGAVWYEIEICTESLLAARIKYLETNIEDPKLVLHILKVSLNAWDKTKPLELVPLLSDHVTEIQFKLNEFLQDYCYYLKNISGTRARRSEVTPYGPGYFLSSE